MLALLDSSVKPSKERIDFSEDYLKRLPRRRAGLCAHGWSDYCWRRVFTSVRSRFLFNFDIENSKLVLLIALSIFCFPCFVFVCVYNVFLTKISFLFFSFFSQMILLASTCEIPRKVHKHIQSLHRDWRQAKTQSMRTISSMSR